MGKNKSGRKNFDKAKNFGSALEQMKKNFRGWGGNVSESDKRKLYNSKRRNNK